jgi:hypothetical protein
MSCYHQVRIATANAEEPQSFAKPPNLDLKQMSGQSLQRKYSHRSVNDSHSMVVTCTAPSIDMLRPARAFGELDILEFEILVNAKFPIVICKKYDIVLTSETETN